MSGQKVIGALPFKVALNGFVPLRRMPSQKFLGLTLTLDGTLTALEQVPVFARIERISRHYGGPLSKGV